MAYVPVPNQSVSGTVHVDNFSSVISYQAAGSVLATSTTVNTGNSSVQVLNFPPNQSVSGTIVANQGTNPWLVKNSIVGIVDSINSSSSALGANSSFTGAIVDALGFAQISATSYSDVGSAANGLQVQWSSDGVNFDHIHQDQIPASTFGFLSTGVHNRYYRVVYVNGGTNQTAFRLQTIQSNRNIPNEYISADFPITTNEHAQVFKGIIAGKTTAGGGAYVDVKVDPSGAIVTAASSVVAFLTSTNASIIATPVGNQSVSGAVSVSNFPTNQNVSGSVVATQGTSPWVVNFQNPSIIAFQLAGSVLSAAISGTPNVNVAGSVVAFQGGSPWQNSVWSAVPGTPIRYTGSVVSTSVTLIQASAASKKSYITDFWASNTDGTNGTLVTFLDGSTSILGRTIAPSKGGSNSPGISVPMVTATAQDLTFQAGSGVSILYLTVNGYQI